MLGAILGPLATYAGGQEANEANSTSAKDAMRYSDKSERRQMAFQREMANTAVQRRKEDLQRAGFNPLLALQSEASSPAGGSSSGSTSQHENVLGAAAASAREYAALALQAKKQKAEVSNIEANTSKMRTEEKVISKGIPEADMKNKFYDSIKPIVDKLSKALKSGVGPKLPKHVQEDEKAFRKKFNIP